MRGSALDPTLEAMLLRKPQPSSILPNTIDPKISRRLFDSLIAAKQDAQSVANRSSSKTQESPAIQQLYPRLPLPKVLPEAKQAKTSKATQAT